MLERESPYTHYVCLFKKENGQVGKEPNRRFYRADAGGYNRFLWTMYRASVTAVRYVGFTPYPEEIDSA
jgi:hypothetical protein